MNYEIINVDLRKSMTNKLMKEYRLLNTCVCVVSQKVPVPGTLFFLGRQCGIVVRAWAS